MLLREPVQPTPLDLAPKASLYALTPLIALVMTSGTVFFVTLLIGVWAAYDLATALIRFAVIATGLATMIGIVWAGRYHAKTILGLVGVACALGAAGISIAYGLRFTHNSGAVASGLMVLLPLAICGVWWQWVSHENRLLWPAGGAVVIALVTFLLTSERTAWIGLGIGVLGAGYIDWRLGAPNSSDSVMRRASDWVLGFGVLSGLVVYSVLFFTPTLDGIIGHTAIGHSLLERAELWRESLALSREYYFTGSGLGMTTMVYSTYVLSMHVPYWYHAHNLYLQIALEQGVPGVLAFVGMALPLLGSLVHMYRNMGPYSRWFCLATITALIASLSYGLLDAELYATPMVAVMFVPLGFALALCWAQLNRHAVSNQTPRFRYFSPLVGGAGVMPVVALVVLCLWPGAREKLYTNLGVLSQTKAELRLYDWSIWSIQDELRRRGAVDLSAAIAYYEAALALDPNNATAHRRLGQIALSQGNYPAALDYLDQAYKVEPDRDSIHRLLGEVYAVTGDVADATALWRSVDIQQEQIDDRLWWYGHLDAIKEVHWIEQAFAQSKH